MWTHRSGCISSACATASGFAYNRAMGEPMLFVVDVYHILLLLIPIAGGGAAGLLVLWKYLISPALAHRHETDLALHVLKIDVTNNDERITKIETEGDASARRIYGRLEEIVRMVAALGERLAHFEGRLAIKE